MDIRVANPCTFILAGPSGSGKTQRVFRFLEFADYIFQNPNCAKHVFYFYKVWTKDFNQNLHLVHEWINEIPTSDKLQQLAEPYKHNDGCIVIIDDFGDSIGKNIEELFRVTSHHSKITAFMLVQNLFPRCRYMMAANRNATHYLVFQNHRDKSQIVNFLKQFAPGQSKYLTGAFKKHAEENPYSYLWFDCHPKTQKCLRIKSNVLLDEWPPFTWISD